MKKYLVLGLMVLVVGVSAVALAHDTTTNTTSTTTPVVASSSIAGPMMVNIGPNGNVLLRGTIVGTPSTDSLVVKSWGGSWTINVLATTNILSANKALSDFKADDVVGVLGSIAADGDFSINARILRAWGHRLDSDHDGIPDNQDNDDDNDGLDNSHDLKHNDHDNDGIVDSLDTDDDGDGILDTEDSKAFDFNNDGIPDGRERHHGRDPFKMMEKMMDGRGPRGPGGEGENRGSDDNSGSGENH